jgi:hypothetical protein
MDFLADISRNGPGCGKGKATTGNIDMNARFA